MQWTVKLKGDLAKQGGFLGTPPVSAGDFIFIATLSGELLQFEPSKGTMLKSRKLGHPVRYQPSVEGGNVYVGTQDGKVICIRTGDKKNTGWPMWGGNAQRTGLQGK